ncbi:hypothetical protein JCM14076_28990 [Methylosoma difficile]
MAFVNEIVSEENIQKYGLDELKKDFDHFGWLKGRPEGFWHAWTIDRERSIYFMQAKMIEENGPSGRPEPTTKDIFILNIKGIDIRILLDRVRCSKWITESPFYIGWSLLEIDMPSSFQMSREDVIQILKEALKVYGPNGPRGKQALNTIVEFDF